MNRITESHDIEQELRALPNLRVHVSREFILNAVIERKQHRRRLGWTKGNIAVGCAAACVGIAVVISNGVVSSSAKNYVKPGFHQKVSVVMVPPSPNSHPEGAGIGTPFHRDGKFQGFNDYKGARAFVGTDFPVIEIQSVGQYGVFEWSADEFAIRYSINGHAFNDVSIWHGAKEIPELQALQVEGGKQVYTSEDALKLGNVTADVWHLKCDDWLNKEWTYVTWKRGDWTLMLVSTLSDGEVYHLARELDQSTQQLEGLQK